MEQEEAERRELQKMMAGDEFGKKDKKKKDDDLDALAGVGNNNNVSAFLSAPFI